MPRVQVSFLCAVFLIALALPAVTACGASAKTDRETLTALYHATDGPNWRRSSDWLTDAPLDAWYGVRTDEDGRVIQLDLAFNELSGRIPPELGNLDRLQRLYLTAEGPVTTLRGSVSITTGDDPKSIGSQMKELGNQISTETTIHRNYLSGCIPASLRKHLDVDSSNLGGLSFCDEG